jgi:hypothetical protein
MQRLGGFGDVEPTAGHLGEATELLELHGFIFSSCIKS